MSEDVVARVPQPVADALISLSEAEQAAALGEAMYEALELSPQERVELMRDALSVSERGMAQVSLAGVDSDAIAKFESFVASKHLWRDVLLTGALMRRLEVAAGDKTSLPWCPEVPRK